MSLVPSPSKSPAPATIESEAGVPGLPALAIVVPFISQTVAQDPAPIPDLG